MFRYVSSPQDDDGATPLVGVLLVNLGTPDDPTTGGVRRFLAQMLADPRIVELPRLLWLPILHGVILRIRPRRSARAYRKIWTSEGSPQLVIGKRIANALAIALPQAIAGFAAVELGMRYGNPSIPDALARLRAAGARRILVLPLFPQYAGATTASAFDAVTHELRRWRRIPAMNFIADYHDEPQYIAALAASAREHWQAHGRAEHLLMSFHGMPRRCIEQGDPYFSRCQRTAQLLAAALDLREGAWSLSFQSRFGRQEWLRPYTIDALSELASRGVKHIEVICPGFSMDCLESLEEIALAAAETFKEHGGQRLDYIPALNERADHVAFLVQLIAKHCAGWSEGTPDRVSPANAAAPRDGTQRPRIAGGTY